MRNKTKKNKNKKKEKIKNNKNKTIKQTFNNNVSDIELSSTPFLHKVKRFIVDYVAKNPQTLI